MRMILMLPLTTNKRNTFLPLLLLVLLFLSKLTSSSSALVTETTATVTTPNDQDNDGDCPDQSEIDKASQSLTLNETFSKTVPEADTDTTVESIWKWLLKEQHDKVEGLIIHNNLIQYQQPKDDNTKRIMWTAAQPLKQDQVLMEIPKQWTLTLDTNKRPKITNVNPEYDQQEEDDDDDDEENSTSRKPFESVCRLALKLMQEFNQNNKNRNNNQKIGPYVDYLINGKDDDDDLNTIYPSSQWSNALRLEMRTLFGNELGMNHAELDQNLNKDTTSPFPFVAWATNYCLPQEKGAAFHIWEQWLVNDYDEEEDQEDQDKNIQNVQVLERALRVALTRGHSGQLIPIVEQMTRSPFDATKNSNTDSNVYLETKTVQATANDSEDQEAPQQQSIIVLKAARDIPAGQTLTLHQSEYKETASWTFVDWVEQVGIVPTLVTTTTATTSDVYFDFDTSRFVDATDGELAQFPHHRNQHRVAFTISGNDDNGSQRTLTWYHYNPNYAPPLWLGQLNWLHAHVRRLAALRDHIHTTAKDTLVSHKEYQFLTNVYQELERALKTALASGVDAYVQQQQNGKESESMPSSWDAEHVQKLLCMLDNSTDVEKCESNVTTTQMSSLDDLQPRPDWLDYEFTVARGCEVRRDYVWQDETSSFYQSIRFRHTQYTETWSGLEHYHHKHSNAQETVGRLNTCLWLSDWLQSCTSFRPHYHEWIIHYPAMFLPKVERVLFLGGGDIMILDEIMKYENQLEFVIGMELDQQVVRQSFRNSAIQPHFDNPKVRWYFGDATKSLLTLPKEYHGTFDLVLVDLQNFVVDTVMVTPKESIMDVAMKMLKPTGILARNEDFVQRKNAEFAKYTIDMEIHDVPRLCQQSLTMGSNGIDFMSFDVSQLVDHKVDNVYFKFPGGAANGQYGKNGPHFTDNWTVYRNNQMQEATKASMEDEKEAPIVPHHGILTVVEAEKVKMDLSDFVAVKKSLEQTLKDLGLTVIYAVTPKNQDGSEKEKDPDGFSMIFVMEQGYLAANSWPAEAYCALDLLLWSDFEKQTAATKGIVLALGGNFEEQKTTYFSLVTGGRYGVKSMPQTGIASKEVSPKKETDHASASASVSAVDYFVPILRTITTSLLEASTDTNILVVCGEASETCRAREALSKNSFTLNACPELSTSDEIMACLNLSQTSFVESIAETGMIDAVIFDTSAPREMGQIVHKLFQSGLVRDKVLKDKHVVLTLSTNVTDIQATWQYAFLERFRTEMAIFNPAYHTWIEFGNELSFGIFTAGSDEFYSNLMRAKASIAGATNLSTRVQDSKSGVVSYMPDFLPSTFVTNDMYDIQPSAEQWLGQELLAQQAILQFEIQLPKPSIPDGHDVLFNDYAHNWYGTWLPGRVRSSSSGKKSLYEISLSRGGAQNGIERDLIRKVEASTGPYKFGDRVLIQRFDSGQEVWHQGSISNTNADGTYKVRLFQDSYGESVVTPDTLMYQFEAPDPNESSGFTTEKLKTVLSKVLSHYFGDQIDVTMHVFEGKTQTLVGDGALIVALADQELMVVASWDGQIHLDVNILSFYSNRPLDPFSKNTLIPQFLEDIPYLSLVSHDEQPRGAGRIVNGLRDLDSFWFGQLLDEYSDESG